MKCDRCNREWSEDNISILILAPEGSLSYGCSNQDTAHICSDCRAKLWTDIFMDCEPSEK